MTDKKTDLTRITVTVFFLMALAFGVFFCCIKSGMFIDEVITIGQANSSTGGWLTDGEINGRVITGREISDYLTVDPGERFDITRPYRNLSSDVHPPLYHMLLTVFSSFAAGSFSKWPGLILNLILYMLGNVLIYLICRRVSGSRIISGLTMLLYALSLSALSSLIFIRMYIMLSFLTLLLLYEILMILESPRPAMYPAVTATILAGILTQYNFVFSAFFMCLLALIVFLKRKEIKTAVCFSISAIAGVCLFIPAFPAVFSQFNIGAGDGHEVSGGAAMRNLLDLSVYPRTIAMNLVLLLSDSMAAVEIAILAAAILLITLMYLKYRSDSKGYVLDRYRHPEGSNAGTILTITLITLVLSFLAVSLTVTYPDQRYLYYLQALLYPSICWLLSVTAHYISQIRRTGRIAASAAIAAVLAASILALVIRPLPYLYTDYGKYTASLEGHTECPCIYVDPGDYGRIDESALQFLIHSDDVYVASPDDLDSDDLRGYVNGHASNGELLIYLHGIEGNGTDVIRTLSDEFGYQNIIPLFTDVRTPCYLIVSQTQDDAV